MNVFRGVLAGHSHHGGPTRGRKRCAEHIALRMLRKLERGDSVTAMIAGEAEEDVEVVQVDRFKREVRVLHAGSLVTVAANDVQWIESDTDTDDDDERPPSKQKVRKSASKYQRKSAELTHSSSHTGGITKTEDRTDNTSETNVDDNKGHSNSSDRITDESCGSFGHYCGVNAVVPAGPNGISTLVSIGDIFSLHGVNAQVAVGKLKNCPSQGGYRFEGLLLNSDKEFSGLTVSGATDALSEAVVLNKPSKSLKTGMCNMKQRACEDTVRILRYGNYADRAEVRRSTVANLLKAEISACFKSRCLMRHCVLGLSDLAVDGDLFSLKLPPPSRSVFSLQRKNMVDLDSFLHKFWDVHVSDGMVKYLTKVVISLDKHMVLKASLKCAISVKMNELSANYRELVAEEIIRSCTNQDSEDEGGKDPETIEDNDQIDISGFHI